MLSTSPQNTVRDDCGEMAFFLDSPVFRRCRPLSFRAWLMPVLRWLPDGFFLRYIPEPAAKASAKRKLADGRTGLRPPRRGGDQFGQLGRSRQPGDVGDRYPTGRHRLLTSASTSNAAAATQFCGTACSAELKISADRAPASTVLPRSGRLTPDRMPIYASPDPVIPAARVAR